MADLTEISVELATVAAKLEALSDRLEAIERRIEERDRRIGGVVVSVVVAFLLSFGALVGKLWKIYG